MTRWVPGSDAPGRGVPSRNGQSARREQQEGEKVSVIQEQRELDPEQLMAFVFRAVGEVGATLNTALVVMGDKLGLYRALAGAGPLTSGELAQRTGVSERYVVSGSTPRQPGDSLSMTRTLLVTHCRPSKRPPSPTSRAQHFCPGSSNRSRFCARLAENHGGCQVGHRDRMARPRQ